VNKKCPKCGLDTLVECSDGECCTRERWMCGYRRRMSLAEQRMCDPEEATTFELTVSDMDRMRGDLK
jgi:hypothetical protein